MIEVYKLQTNMYDDNTVQLDTNSDTRTRGHTKKLIVRRCRYDVRKYSFSIHFFSPRVLNRWNSLSQDSVDACSANAFEWHLDKI